MADNFTVEPVVGVPVKTFRGDEIGGITWPASKTAWGPDGTAVETADAAGARLPVKVGAGLEAASVLTGQATVGTLAAAFPSVVARRVKVQASQANVDVIYIGPATVTAANGYPLWPGKEVVLEVTNLNIMQHISPTAAQMVAYLGEV